MSKKILFALSLLLVVAATLSTPVMAASDCCSPGASCCGQPCCDEK